MIQADTAITILDRDLVVATLTEKVDFEMDLNVGRGGTSGEQQYEAEVEQRSAHPRGRGTRRVQRVRYRVEDTRVGQRTNPPTS